MWHNYFRTIFFFQYIVLSWLREKRKYSSSISLAQFDFDVNFFDDCANDFVALGKNNIILSYLVNNIDIKNYNIYPWIIRLLISGSYSRITMQLVFNRKIQYHLFRTYLPSGLFVIIGWLSLYIPVDHVPGRVTMGMTTILTLAAMFSAIATTTPRVSYR